MRMASASEGAGVDGTGVLASATSATSTVSASSNARRSDENRRIYRMPRWRASKTASPRECTCSLRYTRRR